MLKRLCLALQPLTVALSQAHAAVVCPPMPAAVTTISRDVKSDIDASVGSLGKVKAGDLASKTEVTAKNLFDKYPNVDRLLTQQTMAATYCAMLNAAALSDGERLQRWERFQDKLLSLPAAHQTGAPTTATRKPPPASRPLELVGQIEEVKTTGNHHCESHCQGEPTRTGYSITLKVPTSKSGVEQQLKNPKLTCIAGPCVFSAVTLEPRIAPDGLSATASFDVWSKPMTWKLSADYFQTK